MLLSNDERLYEHTLWLSGVGGGSQQASVWTHRQVSSGSLSASLGSKHTTICQFLLRQMSDPLSRVQIGCSFFLLSVPRASVTPPEENGLLAFGNEDVLEICDAECSLDCGYKQSWCFVFAVALTNELIHTEIKLLLSIGYGPGRGGAVSRSGLEGGWRGGVTD